MKDKKNSTKQWFDNRVYWMGYIFGWLAVNISLFEIPGFYSYGFKKTLAQFITQNPVYHYLLLIFQEKGKPTERWQMAGI